MDKTKEKKRSADKAVEAEVIKLDAQGQPVGRLASQIATYLQGKHRPDYAPYLEGVTVVEVEHADQVQLTGHKWSDKIYYHHTGYLGHLKSISAEDLHQKKPHEILRLAVLGMLPKNRLRSRRIKRLKFV
ncbi:MAG TPA: 50S ribosomal protein L13 [Candidatus Pacearchaeota archaeon]|nr:50S ribosomal protein L13 [Candidatus Pacearchaeota archaeon]